MCPTSPDPAVAERVEGAVAKLDLAAKVRLLTGSGFWTTYPEPRVGLRAMVLSDGPVGVRGETWDERATSVNVPSPTALAATWDEPLVERLGALLAGEARRKGVDVLLAPTVNLHRTPLGGTSSATPWIRFSPPASARRTCAACNPAGWRRR